MKKKAAISVGVIVVLLLLYEFFLVKLPEPQKQQALPVEKSAQEERTRDILGKSGASSLEQFLESLSANTAGSDAPISGAPPQEQQPAQQPPSHPDENAAIKEAISAYLAASSNIGFPDNRSSLALALVLAEKGNGAKLEGIIKEFEERFVAFEALVPPPPVKDIHDATADIITRYIQLMKDARDKKAGTVQATWNSAARQQILADAAVLVQEIRTLVASYGLELTSEVLP